MLWLVGVGLALFAALIGTVGKQFIRLSEVQMQPDKSMGVQIHPPFVGRRPDSSVSRKARSFYVVGMLLNCALTPLCDILSYTFAPASVIAPFTGMSIVWNTLLAPCWLKEELTRPRLISCIVVFLIATVTVVCFSDNDNKPLEWTPDHVREMLFRQRSVAYFLCFFCWLVVNIGHFMRYPLGSSTRGISIGATAGTLAGNMWCTKIATEFGTQCANDHCEVWEDPIAWFIIAGAVAFALSGLFYMQLGCKQYEALFMVTIFTGSNIVGNSISASLVLGEMDDSPWWKILGHSVCVLLMVGGMAILVKGGNKAVQPGGRAVEPMIAA
jgi:drug/metabolite transporter (DMT)-like permease